METTTQMDVRELLARIDAGEPVRVLDVRNDDDFLRWRLEGARPVETLHVPYFEFVEDEDAAVGRLPGGAGELAVLCAQGGSSDYVAGVLRARGLPARNVAGGMVAYGEALFPVRVPLHPEDEGRLEIWQVNRRGKGCLSYVIRSGDEAMVVDPARHAEWYASFADGLGARVARVMDTHVHADHLSGGAALAARYRLPYSPAVGAGGELGRELEIRALATPGHTPGSISLLVGGRYLLSGDTLFVSGVGRPDLGGDVEGWARALHRTLREQIAPLPDGVLVLPAHWSSAAEARPDGVVAATLGELRRTAPELQLASEDDFAALMHKGARPAPAAYAEMVRVNLGLATCRPAQAAEWELGRNECAAGQKRKQEVQ
ncbi:MAG TPA: MBL fold metallo-hydrolase [Myxococcales bacterium]|nr:MBL fold metallo-hydrolase [Myxococcales bacterium]